MPKALNILISPLDWGLGHASRMIPLLRQLEAQGHHLMIGVSELTRPFIKEHIPNAHYYAAPSYGIKYSKWGSFLSFVALGPRIFKAKQEEYEWVEKFVKSHKVDMIISDSRFGFRYTSIKSIILSHQLNLQFPKYLKWPGKWAQKVNEKWLSAFDEIWVPDSEDHYLSGDLSENPGMKYKLLGIQSRFEKGEESSPEKEDYVLCILSGPEPQRSIFERMIRQQSPQIKQHVVIIGGKPHEPGRPYNCANTTYFNHLDSKKLATYIRHADLVISRSGYSSLMDYQQLACKKLFLIPSPGQTEQIYLAHRMKQMNICDFAFQAHFNLNEVILGTKDFLGFSKKENSHSLLQKTLNNAIESIY